jgi:hypothetical protein
MGHTFALGAQRKLESYSKKELEEALTMSPSNSLLLQTLGQRDYNAHFDKRALRRLRKAAEGSPANFKAAGNLIALHLALGDLTQAAKVAQWSHGILKGLLKEDQVTRADTAHVVGYNALLFLEAASTAVALGEVKKSQALIFGCLFLEDSNSYHTLSQSLAPLLARCNSVQDQL